MRDDGLLPAPAWVCLMTFVAACGDDVRIERGGPSSPDLAPLEPVAPPDLSGTDAGWVFDELAVREYQLALAPEAWEALKASAASEEYVVARLSVDGAEFGDVGLRFKGSRGTLGRCASNGALHCPKLSMKLKFDEYDAQRRFFGLKRLNFNSMISDPSELHERLAYRLFREMGVAAPRAGHARLAVNGESLGVFTLVEQIDGRFTDDRFAGGDGNLYKEQWPITNDPAALDATLETNEEAPDHGLMIQFREDLVAATAEGRAEVVARYMDPSELFAYLAVDRVTTNWDGFSGFYCRGRGCYNHNYYLYQHEHEDRFSVIPWDLDNTFRVTTPYEDVPMPLVLPESCSTRYPIFGSVRAMAPACELVFQGLALSDREGYREQVDRLLAGPFDLARLDTWIDERLEQLSEYVALDTRGPTLTAFQAAVETLRYDVRILAQRLLAERDGERLPRFELGVDAVNGFEATSPLGLQLGVTRQSAPESRVIAALDDAGALDGERHLDVSFAFPPGGSPDDWARVRLDLEGDAVDLSAKGRVRLLIEADRPRSVRVAIDSAIYTSPDLRAVFGWDVSLDGTRQVIELPLATAAYPAQGPAGPESLSDVLQQATALLLEPRAVERKDRARPSSNSPDLGKIHVDRIEFVTDNAL